MLTKSSPTLAKSLFLLTVMLALDAAVGAAEPTKSLAAAPAAAPSGTAAAPSAAEAHFDVHEYRVLGNTVLSNREIETVLYPLLGDQKTLADVEVARTALEKAFHDRGYQTVFVDIRSRRQNRAPQSD